MGFRLLTQRVRSKKSDWPSRQSDFRVPIIDRDERNPALNSPERARKTACVLLLIEICLSLFLGRRDNIPNGSIVGSSQTGALGYFASNLKVINLDGVVNKRCFEALKEKKDIEYIRQMKIEYIIGRQENIDFIRRESASIKPDDLVFIRSIDSFKSWWDTWHLYGVKY